MRAVDSAPSMKFMLNAPGNRRSVIPSFRSSALASSNGAGRGHLVLFHVSHGFVPVWCVLYLLVASTRGGGPKVA